MKHSIQFLVDLEENYPLHAAYENLKKLPFVKVVYLQTKKFLEMADRRHKYQIPFESILFIEAMGNYTKVVTENNHSYCFSCTLKKIVQKLPSNLFLRPHRSYIVNKMFVRTWGKNFLEMIDGTSVPLSRYRK
ncbi:MAG: hypothetical protein OHK0045_15700 [Raineya sp.]